MKPIEVKCPTCKGTSTIAASNKYRPFCSDRCKLIDLGAWASEDYKIPVSPTAETQEWEESESDPS